MAQENEFDHKTPEHMSQDQNDIFFCIKLCNTSFTNSFSFVLSLTESDNIYQIYIVVFEAVDMIQSILWLFL